MMFRELCFSCTNLVSCADVRVFDGGKATCNVKNAECFRRVWRERGCLVYCHRFEQC